jgi:hypothetical protein
LLGFSGLKIAQQSCKFLFKRIVIFPVDEVGNIIIAQFHDVHDLLAWRNILINQLFAKREPLLTDAGDRHRLQLALDDSNILEDRAVDSLCAAAETVAALLGRKRVG